MFGNNRRACFARRKPLGQRFVDRGCRRIVRPGAGAGNVDQLRLDHVPYRARIDKHRRAEAKAADAAANRNFDLDPPHVIGTAADGVVADHLIRQYGGALVQLANDARADAADVEATQIGTEEPVREPDRVDPRRWILLQRVNVTALAVDRQDEAARQEEIFGRIYPGARISRVAAQSREVLAEDDPLAARRPDSVAIVEDK